MEDVKCGHLGKQHFKVSHREQLHHLLTEYDHLCEWCVTNVQCQWCTEQIGVTNTVIQWNAANCTSWNILKAEIINELCFVFTEQHIKPFPTNIMGYGVWPTEQQAGV